MLLSFMALYEGYLGCAPFFPIWLSLFDGELKTDSCMLPCVRVRVSPRGQGVSFYACHGRVYSSGISHVRHGTVFFFYMKETVPTAQVKIPSFSRALSRPRNLDAVPQVEDIYGSGW
jgi:hypothetical protein